MNARSAAATGRSNPRSLPDTTTVGTPNFEQVMAELGVTRDLLTDDQYAELDTNGYLAIPDVMDDDWVAVVNDRAAGLLEREGDAAGQEAGGPMPGAAFLADLFNKGEMFVRTMSEPRVLAAVWHVLGEFRVNSLNYRAAVPGQGSQDLHSDTGTAGGGGPYRLCNSMWMLDDFTAENGATKVVPGSHLCDQIPAEALDDPGARHPQQVQATGKAGTVVVFNAHLWHGGSQNRTDRERRGLTLSFCLPGAVQQTNQAEHIRQRVYDQLSPSERLLLGV